MLLEKSSGESKLSLSCPRHIQTKRLTNLRRLVLIFADIAASRVLLVLIVQVSGGELLGVEKVT